MFSSFGWVGGYFGVKVDWRNDWGEGTKRHTFLFLECFAFKGDKKMIGKRKRRIKIKWLIVKCQTHEDGEKKRKTDLF